MRTSITFTAALAGLAHGQLSTITAYPGVSAFSDLQPYITEEYRALVSVLSDALTALPSTARVSDLANVNSYAIAEVAAGASDLAAFFTQELALASAPTALANAASVDALKLLQGFVPIAESMISDLFPGSMPLTQLPATLLAVEATAISMLANQAPQVFIAGADKVTSDQTGVTSWLPEAIETWLAQQEMVTVVTVSGQAVTSTYTPTITATASSSTSTGTASAASATSTGGSAAAKVILGGQILGVAGLVAGVLAM